MNSIIVDLNKWPYMYTDDNPQRGGFIYKINNPNGNFINSAICAHGLRRKHLTQPCKLAPPLNSFN